MPSINAQAAFTGEGDVFVDALVSSCQNARRGSLEAPCMPHLVGRELQAFDFSDSEPLPCPPSKRGGKRKQGPLPPSPPSGQAAPGSPSSSARKPGKKQHAAAGGVSPSAGATAAKVTSGPTNAAGKPLPPAGARSPAAASSARTSTNGGTARQQYACPGVFSSPKPDSLPLPSSSLLRAASAALGARAVMVTA